MPTAHDVDTRTRVLLWRRKGWSAQRIADKLGVSVSGVYYHLRRLEEDGELNGVELRAYRRSS